MPDLAVGTQAAHPFDLARQAAWEIAAVQRAVDRYREIAETQDPSSLPPGRMVLRETVGPISAVLERRQDEAASATTKPTLWHAPVLLFRPDVLAVVGVACALRSCSVAQSRRGSPLTVYARRVGAALRDQADHDRWVSATIRAAKADDESAKALLTRWRRHHPQGDRRAWTRFASRVEGARSSPWVENVRLALGGVLASALAEGAPRWFQVDRCGTGPAHMHPLWLLLTDYTVERLAETETRAEVARPLMLPMLIPPNPWRYVEQVKREERTK